MNKHLAQPPPTEDQIITLVQRELGENVTALTTLRSGAWSSAVAASTPNSEYVIRFGATADDFRCDELAATFSGPNLPIPGVHAIGQLDDRFWCMSYRMPGTHLNELTTDQMKLALPSLAATLTAMRDVDSSSTHGYGGWDAHGNGVFASFADQLMDVAEDIPDSRGGGWKQILNQHKYERNVFDKGLVILERLCTHLPNDRHLVHQDTLNYNVVVHNNIISGIFDWGCAMWGDAVYDLAWFRFWNPWYPQWAGLDIPGYLERKVGINGAQQHERMRCYLLHIGLMHIRYNAFIGNLVAMNEVAMSTERLLG